MRIHSILAGFSLAVLLSTGAAHAQTAKKAPPVAALFPQVKPESVGFSSAALKEIDKTMQGIVDKGHLSGVVTLLARHGEVVHHKAFGYQDIADQTPMRLDTIVRIYSMTKPITGAALMMLSITR